MADTTTQTEHTEPKPGAHGAAAHGHGPEHGHADGEEHDPIHDANPFLAHHFDTPQQQFDSGKLGIWLFLLTEVLFFAGLFCAYTIYRAMRPEVFVYAHYFLDTRLGAANTCVLLISSLTAAWAVRNAQLGQHKHLVFNIIVTIVCACTFMGIKYTEYAHKAHHGLLWGPYFDPDEKAYETEAFKHKHPEAAEYAEQLAQAAEQKAKSGKKDASDPAAAPEPRPRYEQIEPLLQAGMIGPKAEPGHLRPRNAHVFFSLYFFMTGLHGVHVLVGIGIWIWMLTKALRHQFGANYFGPVDYAALYWHLVDLIWIYLFPLLYLIH